MVIVAVRSLRSSDENVYYAKHAVTIWSRCEGVSIKHRYFVTDFLKPPILHSSWNIAIFNHAASCVVYYRPRKKYYFTNIPNVWLLNAEIWRRCTGDNFIPGVPVTHPTILKFNCSFYKLIFNVASSEPDRLLPAVHTVVYSCKFDTFLCLLNNRLLPVHKDINNL